MRSKAFRLMVMRKPRSAPSPSSPPGTCPRWRRRGRQRCWWASPGPSWSLAGWWPGRGSWPGRTGSRQSQGWRRAWCSCRPGALGAGQSPGPPSCRWTGTRAGSGPNGGGKFKDCCDGRLWLNLWAWMATLKYLAGECTGDSLHTHCISFVFAQAKRRKQPW